MKKTARTAALALAMITLAAALPSSNACLMVYGYNEAHIQKGADMVANGELILGVQYYPDEGVEKANSVAPYVVEVSPGEYKTFAIFTEHQLNTEDLENFKFSNFSNMDNWGTPEFEGEILNPVNLIIHPNWDLVIMELDGNFSNHAGPVELGGIPANVMVRIGGFGSSQYVGEPFEDRWYDYTARGYHMRSNAISSFGQFAGHRIMIFSTTYSYPLNGRSMPGDSGSPVYTGNVLGGIVKAASFNTNNPSYSWAVDFGEDGIAEWIIANTHPEPQVVGDLTGDGVVNVFDLLELLAAWGVCEDCDNCPADLDGDCNVNVFDLLTLLANWG